MGEESTRASGFWWHAIAVVFTNVRKLRVRCFAFGYIMEYGLDKTLFFFLVRNLPSSFQCSGGIGSGGLVLAMGNAVYESHNVNW